MSYIARQTSPDPMQAFPGRDIMSMLVKQPRLLWCTDLPGRMEGAVGLLMRIHPSKDIDVIRDIFAEYPELLYRMVSAAVHALGDLTQGIIPYASLMGVATSIITLRC